MPNPEDSQGWVSENQESLKRLERAMSLSQGEFSLSLVCCQSPLLRRQVVDYVQQHSCVQIQVLTLHPSVKTLFTTIDTALGEQLPQALMILGLESVVQLDRLLSATNLVRDEFPKHFPFPVVMWIDDPLLQKLIRLAPDFKSWAANPIRFEPPKKQPSIQTAITA